MVTTPTHLDEYAYSAHAIRMPNRTVYLPDDLDQVSRRLKLNLSRLVQDAIRDVAFSRTPEEVDQLVKEASARAQGLDIDH